MSAELSHIVRLLEQARDELGLLDRRHKQTVEKNIDLFKVLATVKNDLEKTLKKPETLHETIYRCIDLLRENTPYFSTNEGVTKVDPPLTQDQKTLDKSNENL